MLLYLKNYPLRVHYIFLIGSGGAVNETVLIGF